MIRPATAMRSLLPRGLPGVCCFVTFCWERQWLEAASSEPKNLSAVDRWQWVPVRNPWQTLRQANHSFNQGWVNPWHPMIPVTTGIPPNHLEDEWSHRSWRFADPELRRYDERYQLQWSWVGLMPRGLPWFNGYQESLDQVVCIATWNTNFQLFWYR